MNITIEQQIDLLRNAIDVLMEISKIHSDVIGQIQQRITELEKKSHGSGKKASRTTRANKNKR